MPVMKRDPEQYPAPHIADVHPDEVDNYRVGGWEVDEAAATDEPEKPKRGRKPKALEQ